jgi:hypothetical protein
MAEETADIREEMNHTRADLDYKLTRLEARARELRPRAVARRFMPEYALDRTIGAILTLIGTRMAWGRWRNRVNRRARVQAAFASYGRW